MHIVLAKVNDPRTTTDMSKLYQPDCVTANGTIFGVNAALDSSGNVTNRGQVNNSLVLEISTKTSTMLTTMTFAILAREMVPMHLPLAGAHHLTAIVSLQLGYNISFYRLTSFRRTAERMSSARIGLCSPTHLILETSLDTFGATYALYSNESASAGSVGYTGCSGIYTTTKFVADGISSSVNSPTFSADFWRDYTKVDNLINQLPLTTLTSNSAFYPPAVTGCPNGRFGCMNGCSKTDTCTSREAQGGSCMLVIMMLQTYDPGYAQAVFANLKIPAYFCFLGDTGLESYVLMAKANGLPVVFYHYQPDPFHSKYAGAFQRISLPWATAEKAAVNTGTFGERGYGNKTNNPVAVDFLATAFEKYKATLLEDASPLSGFITRFSVTSSIMTDLLGGYVNVSTSADDPYFSAACTWLRANYATWRNWMEALPICTLRTHTMYTIRGCELNTMAAFPRQIEFAWIDPNPNNASLPLTCDGGIISIPKAYTTSRSCAWLQDNYEAWIDWVETKPKCDASFYFHNTTECDQPNAKRLARFFWNLPDPTNSSRSLECQNGMSLPSEVLFDCEYAPTDTKRYKIVLICSIVLAVLLFVAMILVFLNRSAPIIKRAQYEFLETMIVGGILVCGASVVYAGKPNDALCRGRPSLISYGFTLIFGSLVVKSMRVYRVFLSRAMKRVKLSSKTMFKFLGVFVLVDFLILLAWVLIDPPIAKTQLETIDALGSNQVEVIRCTSTSFIFTALLIFWKAIVLFMGMYLSFAIRNVSTDFQESIWIFACSLVVMFTSILVLPAAYILTMTAMTFFVFLSVALLVSTAVVMAFMLLPKVHRLHAINSLDTATSDTDKDKRGSQGSSTGDQESTVTGARIAPSTRTASHLAAILPAFKMSTKRKTSNEVTPIVPFHITKKRVGSVQETDIQ